MHKTEQRKLTPGKQNQTLCDEVHGSQCLLHGRASSSNFVATAVCTCSDPKTALQVEEGGGVQLEACGGSASHLHNRVMVPKMRPQGEELTQNSSVQHGSQDLWGRSFRKEEGWTGLLGSGGGGGL